MKISKLLILTFLFIISKSAFGQKDGDGKSDWGNYISNSCFQGISVSMISIGYNVQTKSYWYNVRYKSNYNTIVHFNLYYYINGQKITVGRITLNPGQAGSHTSLPAKTYDRSPKGQIDNVCFKNDNKWGSCSDGCYAICDSRPNVPNQPDCNKNTNNSISRNNNSNNNSNNNQNNSHLNNTQVDNSYAQAQANETARINDINQKNGQYQDYYAKATAAGQALNCDEAISNWKSAIAVAVNDAQRQNAQQWLDQVNKAKASGQCKSSSSTPISAYSQTSPSYSSPIQQSVPSIADNRSQNIAAAAVGAVTLGIALGGAIKELRQAKRENEIYKSEQAAIENERVKNIKQTNIQRTIDTTVTALAKNPKDIYLNSKLGVKYLEASILETDVDKKEKLISYGKSFLKYSATLGVIPFDILILLSNLNLDNKDTENLVKELYESMEKNINLSDSKSIVSMAEAKSRVMLLKMKYNYTESKKEEETLILKAAEMDNIHALVRLQYYYYAGDLIIKKDHKKAYETIKKLNELLKYKYLPFNDYYSRLDTTQNITENNQLFNKDEVAKLESLLLKSYSKKYFKDIKNQLELMNIQNIIFIESKDSRNGNSYFKYEGGTLKIEVRDNKINEIKMVLYEYSTYVNFLSSLSKAFPLNIIQYAIPYYTLPDKDQTDINLTKLGYVIWQEPLLSITLYKKP